MCTLSWKPLENGYVLFFNRDESRNRTPAIAPGLKDHNGVSFLTPTDGARGGTWLLVNAHGISIGLLNNYAATPLAQPAQPAEPASRGMLPLACADCSSVGQAIKRIEAMSLDVYPPFFIVIVSSTEATVLAWDGVACVSKALESTGAMLTSSAFQPESTRRARCETFDHLVGDMADAKLEHLRAFHWYRGVNAAEGILMSREDACTHSISQINVTQDEQMACFHYTAQPEQRSRNTSCVQHLALLASEVH